LTWPAFNLAKSERARELARFGQLAMRSNVAVIYSTGHGAVFNGNRYLLDLKYSPRAPSTEFPNQAVDIEDTVKSARARSINLTIRFCSVVVELKASLQAAA
jgi:uncharacterized caspase-like protein